jgi:hypothetical protein
MLVAVCFKYARTAPDLVEKLSRWADTMREVRNAPNGLEALALVMRYILMVNDHVEPEALQALLERTVGPEAKDTIMTAGERLIEQGVQKGERTLLLRQLRRRFGDQVDTETERRLASASVEQIETWGVRVLSAVTLIELFAD